MSGAQPGILDEGHAAGRFLIYRTGRSSSDIATIASTARAIPDLTQGVARLRNGAELVCTVAFGADLWRRLSQAALPRELAPFQPLECEGRLFPATGGDLLIHINGTREDLCLELAMRIGEHLADTAREVEEIAGFRYLDERDLTGFIDGTENPEGEARAAVALIGNEDPDFKEGSYVLTQRFVHDLRKWKDISVSQQEAIIGRTKSDSQELDENVKPQTAHIRRVVIEEAGQELEIVRHSMPYGNTREAGLFFIAYSRKRSTFDKMLCRMIGADGSGLYDRLMDFTQARSGAYFFAPSLAQLRTLSRDGTDGA